tara:strand:- start:179 stop:493 length:315 start_codon:yes stop_codon:yes gene_type:complete
MDKFENVTVFVKGNTYFDGNVSSRTIEFADGSTKTLGIMLPGEYNFSTKAAELMEINAGNVKYKLAGSDQWQDVSEGGSFDVPADSSFDISSKGIVDYCCSFLA